MTSTRRVLSALAMPPVVAGIVLAGTAGTAGAVKPDRGCPPSFEPTVRAEMVQRFPGYDPADFDALFDAIDKNGDLVLCAKKVPGLFNTVDNVASFPIPASEDVSQPEG